MNRKINYAIVGCGAISRTHIRALKQMEKAVLYAVCDKSKERAEKRRRRQERSFILIWMICLAIKMWMP